MSFPALNSLTQGIRATSVSGGTGGGSGTTPVPTPSGPVLTDMLHYWTMDDSELAGSTYTNSGSSSDVLTIQSIGSAATGSVGQVGESIFIEKVRSEYMTGVAAGFNTLTAITVSFWWNSTWPQLQTAFDFFWATQDKGITSSVQTDGNWNVAVWDGAVEYQIGTTGQTINDGNFHLLTFSLSGAGGTLKIYVDGYLLNSMSGVTVAWPTTSLPALGAYQASTPLATASIDDAKVWNYSLTDSQVLDIFLQDGGIPVVPSNMVHHWTMDDAQRSGNVMTNSGTSVDVMTFELTGGASVNGQVGQAVDFQPLAGTYASQTWAWAAETAIASAMSTDFSISYWFKNTAPVSVADVHMTNYLRLSGTALAGISLGLTGSGYFEFFAADGVSNGLNIPSNIDYRDGSFHHVVATYNDSTQLMQLYIDGVLIGTDSLGTNLVHPAGNNLGFGNLSNGAAIAAYSALDEIKIFNYVLTVAQQYDIFIQDGGNFTTVAPTDMIGHYTMDTVDLTGTTMANTGSTGATNDMTLVGSPTTGQIGQVRESVLFSTSSEYATVPSTLLVSATSFGIGGWFSKGASNGTLVSNQVSTAGPIISGLNVQARSAGDLSFSIADDSGSIEGTDVWTLTGTSTGLNDSTFHSWFVSFDLATTTMKLYVDGQLEASRADATTVTYTAATSLSISKDILSFNPILGSQDNIRVFNYAPTNAEVLALHLLDGGT
tara:strand:+ start:2466 stop:4610 length:2145 start_codon:yes stop_codon:yes gene_type:complete